MSERVLIIDDDRKLAEMLVEYLGARGYTVEARGDAASGTAALRARGADAVILDVMLPDADGLDLCRRLRAESDVPILMLTARGEPTDRIVGLELGADDYLPKPFDPRELVARLRAVLRRRAPRSGETLRFGRLEIDVDARVVRKDGEPRPLTGYQFDLLLALARSAGRAVSRETLLERVKGESLEAFDRSIDVHVSRIRALIEDDPRRPQRILTLRGVGYMFTRSPHDEPRTVITRLHHRIYVSLLAVALFGIGGTAVVTHTLFDPGFGSPHDSRLLAEAQFVARTLNGIADDRLPAELERIGHDLRLDLLVVGADGGVVASNGAIVPGVLSSPLGLPHAGAHWLPTRRGRALVVAMDGQRRLAVWARGNRPNVVLLLVVFFGLLALGCMFVARRLTRRLEVLEQGVARLGSGQLSTRVPIQGEDEIARLAERFNWSAERIERLVDAQRRMLLSASHELRSPLARVRVALELIRDRGGADVERRVADAALDIDELDALVDDLLLASRIEIEPPLAAAETIDLASLVAEEAARAGAKLDVAPAPVVGDARLLRRLVRNLLDNAVRHGAGTEIEAGVTPLDGPHGGARLWVADRGPGVAAADRERIFEAFYRGARAPADGSGVGIGLALVRQIAERHGGTAVCRPRDGGGVIFEVTLPNRSASE